MALSTIKIADINIGAAIVENVGRATAYFQRYLQTTNRQITAAINGVIQAQLEAAEALQLAQDAIDATEALLVNITDLLLGMGLASYGLTTVTPDGSGDVAISHTFFSPDYPPTLGACTMTPTGTTYFHPQLTSVDATTLYARLFDAGGAPLTTGSYTVAWRVAGI